MTRLSTSRVYKYVYVVCLMLNFSMFSGGFAQWSVSFYENKNIFNLSLRSETHLICAIMLKAVILIGGPLKGLYLLKKFAYLFI